MMFTKPEFNPAEVKAHPNDCMIINANPTVLKVYGTVVYGRRW